ncbi:MAG TPA: hypothetical protein VGI39_36305 [Polyangiaceae bacterium]|jgi:hypothetical protein
MGVVLALAVAVLPYVLVIRVTALLLALAGVVLAVSIRPARRRAPAGWIVVDSGGVSRERGGSAVRLLAWEERYGVVVLSNESRTRGLLAITTPQQTRYVAVRVAGDEDSQPAAELFARAPVLVDADVVAATVDGEGALTAVDAVQIVRTIRARDAAAVGRILLSDPRGDSVALDGTELHAGGRVIDLAAPLEWRSFVFVESGASFVPDGASKRELETAAAMPIAPHQLLQATWVRQAAVEVVLVAPQADARDPLPRPLRMPSIPDAPPPRELRIAIERFFMTPLRHALDRAPRVSRVPAAPPSPRTPPPPAKSVQG